MKYMLIYCNPFQTEGSYTVMVGVYNPMDGWVMFPEPIALEVVARAGPIFIDDFALITDFVSWMKLKNLNNF